MKKINFVLILILSLSSSIIRAQKEPITNLEHMDYKKFQWGYYFGFNRLDFKFDMKELDYSSELLKDIQVKKSYGFNVGVTTSFRIIDNIDFRVEPGLFYNQRDLYFSGFRDDNDRIRTVRSTYIYLPLLIKVSTNRWYNFKPYLTGGFSTALNLSSGSNLNAENKDQKFRTKDFNFFYELGLGFDIYTPYFRVSPSIRGIFSMKNEIVKDSDPNSPWTGNINSIRTQGFLINLTFE